MKRVFFLTPLALAALAGCAPAPNQIQAGQWELVTEIQSMSVPSAPEEVREQMRARTGRPDAGRACLTEDQARRFLEFTKQVMAQGQASACTFTDEHYAGGELRQNASCPVGSPMGGPARGNQTASLNGRFTATTFNATLRTQGPNVIAPGGGGMNATVILRGRRLGDCPAGGPTPPQPTSL
ncbi:MAG TPA: DUF3617 family protein [Allosphingosinicella sp.]|nr:DUF3617 family protein [Allosphingosinicella sp.]